jgi:hypothetical protein
MKCPNCETTLIWSGDHDCNWHRYPEPPTEPSYITSEYTCDNEKCNVTIVSVEKAPIKQKHTKPC